MLINLLLAIILIGTTNSIEYINVDDSLTTIELSRNYILKCNLAIQLDSIDTYWYKLDRISNISTVIESTDSNKYIIVKNYGFNSSLHILNMQLTDYYSEIYCIGENGDFRSTNMTKFKISNLNQSCLIDQCDCSYSWSYTSWTSFKYLTSMNCSSRKLTNVYEYLVDSNVYNNLELYRFLTYFNFNSNLITKIHADLFTYFTYLNQLDLSNNKIQIIEDGSFKNLQYLKTLYLDNNLIKLINTFTFDGPSEISKLSLSNNKISLIRGSFDSSLTTDLDLSNNGIQVIDESTINNLTNLTKLDLSRNSIRVIVDYSFQSLTYLKNFDLSFNKIEIIGKNTFFGLNNLEILLLNDNNIVEFDVNALNILQNARINLENNLVKIDTWILFCDRNSILIISIFISILFYLNNQITRKLFKIRRRMQSK
jgi:Leucine-rich repeat (LRR) protein